MFAVVLYGHERVGQELEVSWGQGLLLLLLGQDLQFDEEKESECFDCGLNQVETSDHFLFHCPKYEYLRLGWRWSHVSKVDKRYSVSSSVWFLS